MWRKSNKKIQLELLREISQKEKQKKTHETVIDLDLTDPKRQQCFDILSMQGCITGKHICFPSVKVFGLSPQGELKIEELQDEIRQDQTASYLLWMTFAILLMTAALLVLATAPLLRVFWCR